ncbi:hypothetical protein BGZ99_008243 [Dissophora globulifera]|uniref:AB hydrolase-1 domain-containing protein n=1 Tax=Dissophora globulifera TaxID=979702 RepID=A0A9P6RRD8_9FUNG|nr:hypothetical protein BGZ99_008243 [Dissophora globulifera]
MSSRAAKDVPEPRDLTLDPISAPLVTNYSLKALIHSPHFQQTITLASGRTVSYATCGSKTGNPVVYFYGLGGSSRQIASMHAQALRLDIKLISIDRPGTGFTDPFKAPSGRKRKQQRKQEEEEEEDTFMNDHVQSIDRTERAEQEEDGGDDLNDMAVIDSDGNNVVGEEGEQQKLKKPHASINTKGNHGQLGSKRRSKDWKAGRRKSGSASSSSAPRVNERVHHTCLEAIAVVDQLVPGAKFGLMGHSCGIYYIMHMVSLFPDRVQPGPISLLTPWVPFNECPDTTSRTFKFLKHVPRGLVWALTSSINHLGSMILSSSNALSGTMSNKSLHGDSSSNADEQARKNRNGDKRRSSGSGSGSSGSSSLNGSKKDSESVKRLADPFIVQFSDAFDKVVLPALNRQHSNGYNSEIQLCISDVGFEIASVPLPKGVTVSAYCGYLDNIVPIEAARDMGNKCGWEIHEFKHSGHGGPRMSMYALEDYALAVQAITAAKVAEKRRSEKQDRE